MDGDAVANQIELLPEIDRLKQRGEELMFELNQLRTFYKTSKAVWENSIAESAKIVLELRMENAKLKRERGALRNAIDQLMNGEAN